MRRKRNRSSSRRGSTPLSPSASLLFDETPEHSDHIISWNSSGDEIEPPQIDWPQSLRMHHHGTASASNVGCPDDKGYDGIFDDAVCAAGGRPGDRFVSGGE